MWQTYKRLRGSPLREFPEFLQEIAQQYGPVVAFRVPWRRFVFVNDPDAIKALLIRHQRSLVKSEGTRAMQALLGHGLVTSEEPLHRQMRRIVQPAFHRRRIERYAEVMERFACAWTAPAADFDMHAEMMELTLRIASETLFGVDAQHQAERVAGALHDVVEAFPNVLGPFGALRRKLPFGPMARFRRARAELDRIVLDLIAARRSSGEDRGDALSMLLASRDAETGQKLDDRQVRDEVMTLFVAGHETTANALTWTWQLLAQHPEVAAELHRQLQRDRETPYVDAVLSEVLRLYPPAWILGRDALCDLEAAGWRIRKGTTVLMSQLVMHRSARYFENPLAFEPCRWMESPRPPEFAYFPFGGGARKCIGDEFAWTEARIEISNIAQRYAFALAQPAGAEPDPVITLRPRGPVMMRATPR